MARRQLPKAYLRIDPNIDAHPDPGTLLQMIVWGNRQPQRGRFRDLATLRRVLGRRRVAQALERGDLEELPDGRYYLAGWDEWQEGDLTVGERQGRVRARREKQCSETDTACTASPNRARGVSPEDSQPAESTSNAGEDLATSSRYSTVTQPLLDRSTPSEALGRKGVRAVPPTPPADAGGPSPERGGVTVSRFALAASTVEQLCELDRTDAPTECAGDDQPGPEPDSGGGPGTDHGTDHDGSRGAGSNLDPGGRGWFVGDVGAP